MAISDDERFKLRHGPYKTPRFKYGKKVEDEWRGEVTIVGLSSGRINGSNQKTRGQERIS